MQNAFTAAASTSSASRLPQLRFFALAETRNSCLRSNHHRTRAGAAAATAAAEEGSGARRARGDQTVGARGAGGSPCDLWACGTIWAASCGYQWPVVTRSPVLAYDRRKQNYSEYRAGEQSAVIPILGSSSWVNPWPFSQLAEQPRWWTVGSLG